MVGQLVLASRGWGKAKLCRLYGLPVLRAEADPEGFWGNRRLGRAGKNLRLGGILRVLVPRDFDQWPLLERFGLRPIEVSPFLRAQSAPLTLAALERRGLAPDRATVALRGLRADRDMARTAVELCPVVRHLVVDAPKGGDALAEWLRREFGVPILPPGEMGHAALCFQEGCLPREEAALELYGPKPGLAGLSLSAPGLAEEDQEDLSLLSALWEGGKLKGKDIKIT